MGLGERDLVKRQAGLFWILEVTAIAGGLTTAFPFFVYFPLSLRKAFGSPCKCPVHQAASLAFFQSTRTRTLLSYRHTSFFARNTRQLYQEVHCAHQNSLSYVCESASSSEACSPRRETLPKQRYISQ